MKEYTTAYKSNCENLFLCVDKSTSVSQLHDFAMELRSIAIQKMNQALEQDKKAMEDHKIQENADDAKEEIEEPAQV